MQVKLEAACGDKFVLIIVWKLKLIITLEVSLKKSYATVSAPVGCTWLIPLVIGIEQQSESINICGSLIGGSNGVAVAKTIQKLNLAPKGIGGAAFDVGLPVLENIAAGNLAFTVDQQAYLQGSMSIYQLFLYNISGGLITPTDYNTGFKYVTKDTVDAYLQNKDTWEGSSPSPVVFPRPKSISF